MKVKRTLVVTLAAILLVALLAPAVSAQGSYPPSNCVWRQWRWGNLPSGIGVTASGSGYYFTRGLSSWWLGAGTYNLRNYALTNQDLWVRIQVTWGTPSLQYCVPSVAAGSGSGGGAGSFGTWGWVGPGGGISTWQTPTPTPSGSCWGWPDGSYTGPGGFCCDGQLQDEPCYP